MVDQVRVGSFRVVLHGSPFEYIRDPTKNGSRKKRRKKQVLTEGSFILSSFGCKNVMSLLFCWFKEMKHRFGHCWRVFFQAVEIFFFVN